MALFPSQHTHTLLTVLRYILALFLLCSKTHFCEHLAEQTVLGRDSLAGHQLVHNMGSDGRVHIDTYGLQNGVNTNGEQNRTRTVTVTREKRERGQPAEPMAFMEKTRNKLLLRFV